MLLFLYMDILLFVKKNKIMWSNTEAGRLLSTYLHTYRKDNVFEENHGD